LCQLAVQAKSNLLYSLDQNQLAQIIQLKACFQELKLLVYTISQVFHKEEGFLKLMHLL
jgi:hypothetical protein